MAKLLKGTFVSADKMLVEIIYNLDVMENAGINQESGVVVDKEADMPAPEIGKSLYWYVNPVTKEQWFEAYDRPLTTEEQIQQQADEQAQILMTLVANDLM